MKASLRASARFLVLFSALSAGAQAQFGPQRDTLPAGIGNLVPGVLPAGTGFGSVVAVDGNIAVVGRSPVSVVTVFQRSGAGWAEVAQLAPEPGLTNAFGSSLAVSGGRIVVGAPWDSDAIAGGGAVYVFDRGPGGWTQTAKLTTDDAETGDLFGWSVAVDGDRLFGSALYADHTPGLLPEDDGVVYEFVLDGPVWMQGDRINLPGGGYGNDGFGYSIAYEGEVLIVGSPYEKVFGHDRGHARAFQQVGGTWKDVGELWSTADFSGQYMGWSVDVSGDLAVVGAHGDGPGLGFDAPGAAYVYRRNGLSWTLDAKLAPDDELFTFPQFGGTVAIAGKHVLVTAPGGGEDGVISGSVYVFEKTRIGWAQLDEWTASDGDVYGKALAADGNYALVGSPGSDQYGADAGLVEVRSLALEYPNLMVAPNTLSLYDGGAKQRMRLDAGLANAGLPFVLLGSSSGTEPGGLFMGATVPLVFDTYTTSTIGAPGSTPLVGSIGVLDAKGRALCEFVVPPGGFACCDDIGTTYSHAFVVLDPAEQSVYFVGGPAGVTLTY